MRKTWSELDLQRVFVHELEHVKRFDWLTHISTRAICSFYWFHPLVWIAWRQISLEAERACDDAVVVQTEREDYADQLVGLARRLSNALPRQCYRWQTAAICPVVCRRFSTFINHVVEPEQSSPLQAYLSRLLITLGIAPVRAVSSPDNSTATSHDAKTLVCRFSTAKRLK